MSSPSRLGRYAVRRRIGSGGFATVWLCYDEQLDSPVAVKVLADNWAGDHHVRQRFVEEGRFLRKVESPYVVPVYDFGELADDRPFLVMAYADQGNLADRMELGGLSPAQSLQVVREVGMGLTALHGRGVLHRDVKPANVLFRSVEPEPATEETADAPGVRAMLGDLGLGKALDMSSRLTMVGGTPAYVAPEQARGERIDARADQYSLAALTYHLLAGRPAYNHGSLSVAGSPPPLEPLGVDFPEAVEETIRRGMAPDPGQRWPDVVTYTRVLEGALAGVRGDGPGATSAWLPADAELTRAAARPSDGTVTSSGATEQVAASSPARGRRRWPWLVAAVLALLAGLAGGWVAERALNSEVRVADDNGNLAVTVPAEWARVRATEPWTPPGLESSYAALSLGATEDWRQVDSTEPGTFLGIYPGEQLPTELPGHPECSRSGDVLTDSSPLGDMVTVTSGGCPGGGTIIERVIQVADQRLLWVQVHAPDSTSANEVLEEIEVAGF